MSDKFLFSEQHVDFGLDAWIDIRNGEVVGGIDEGDIVHGDEGFEYVEECEASIYKVFARLKHLPIGRQYNAVGLALFGSAHWEPLPFDQFPKGFVDSHVEVWRA